MARWKALAGALLAATIMTGARGASAFCRSTTCDVPDSFESCAGTSPTCQGLQWKRSCLGWTLQKDASSKVPYEVLEDALEQAFEAWMTAGCEGGLPPGLEIQNLGSSNCSDVEYNSLAGNANVVMCRDKGWLHEGGDHNIGLTTVTYDVGTGEIFDADIELNTHDFELTWGDQPVKYDLVSIVTHEAGHFLGLSHSASPEATMNQHYEIGMTNFRDLDIDDQNAMCAVYPPVEVMPACNPIPRHGFSPDCMASQTEGTCSASPSLGAGRGEGGGALPGVIALAALALGRKGARALRERSASRARRAPRRP